MANPASETGTARSLVLLLVDDDRNRELLADHLSGAHDVETRNDGTLGDAAFDLCLVDGPAFRRFEAELERRKAETEPTFLPYLFLAGQGAPDELPAGIRDIVDEVARMPVSKTELDVRVDNLLERRRLSVELTRRKERSEERFESLFRATPDPVVAVTPDGTLSQVNEAFGRTFGIDPEAAVGTPVTDLQLTPRESVERVLLRIEGEDGDGDGDGTSEANPTVQWGGDGEGALILELNTDAVMEVGSAAERIGIFRDVTERVERTRELERQNERLEEFADTIAHDLRNPLNVAQGSLALARESGDEEHLERVATAHDRMEELIEEVLTLARQGQAVLDPDILRLEDVATGAWENVETRDATLETELDGPVRLRADESRITQLFENLFRNAVEHGSTGNRAAPDDAGRASSSEPSVATTPEDAVEHGGEAVTVRVGLLADASGFYVADDGPGIPPEEQEKVFEAGYTDAPDGTGFGLPIVQQTVEGHGWELDVCESESGGARFEIGGVDSIDRPER